MEGLQTQGPQSVNDIDLRRPQKQGFSSQPEIGGQVVAVSTKFQATRPVVNDIALALWLYMANNLY